MKEIYKEIHNYGEMFIQSYTPNHRMAMKIFMEVADNNGGPELVICIRQWVGI